MTRSPKVTKSSPKSKPKPKPKPRTKPKAPFGLPRQIAAQLKACADAHAAGKLKPTHAATYLWIKVAGRTGEPRATQQRVLDWQQWLNVVDESASLGVRYLIICVGDALAKCPDVWRICEWAQQAHRMAVGIHTDINRLSSAEVDSIAQLDPAQTWLFVKKKSLSALAKYEDKLGIKVLAADVGHDEQSPPCDMPEDIVYVAPDGHLYTCGLVLGNGKFKMGHVGEQTLEKLLGNPKRPRRIPKNVPHPEHACDACPPLMVKRMAKGR